MDAKELCEPMAVLQDVAAGAERISGSQSLARFRLAVWPSKMDKLMQKVQPRSSQRHWKIAKHARSLHWKRDRIRAMTVC